MVPTSRLASVLVLCLLAAGQAYADPLAPGDYRLEGKDSDGRKLSVLLHVERSRSDALSFERSEARVETEGGLRRPYLWRSDDVSGDAGALRVAYRQGGRGLCDALSAPDDAAPAAVATYYLSSDGQRLYEWITDGEDWSYVKGGLDYPRLTLVRESRIDALVGDRLDRYEASGVVVTGGRIHVVFDNSTRIGVLEPDLSAGELVKTRGSGTSDFEGLTWDPRRERFYALVELDRHDGDWTGRVWELDAELDRVRDSRLRGLELPGRNKGFEGLAFVRRDGDDYLLALLEGNHGRANGRSRDRGEGRIAVFERKSGGKWSHETTIKLPESAPFSDYSGIDVRDGHIAVVSQTSALLWVGNLDATSWEVDEGQVYTFPRQGSQILYGSVEGVSWLDAGHLVVVSDSSQEGCNAKEESVHVFALPR